MKISKKKRAELIKKINERLIEHFGIPPRKEERADPLDALIGTILSQNTNDRNSWRAYLNLKENFSSWDEVAELEAPEIEEHIRIAGLGNQKANAIKEALNDIVSKKGNADLNYIRDLTDDEIIAELTKYKGVGLKTTSCVLLFSLDRNICPVDTHVHRTMNRTGAVKTSAPDKTFHEIRPLIPEGQAHTFHTNLILLGREFCKPQKPDCPNCPLLDLCGFKEKTREGEKRYNHNNFLLLDRL